MIVRKDENRMESIHWGADTWYKLAPMRKIEKLELHPFNSKLKEEQFN